MRILFVTAHKHLPELRGGMEVNTHDLCQALVRRGVAVGVLCGLAGRGMVGLRARVRIKLLGDAAPMDLTLGYPTWRSGNVVAEVGHVAKLFSPDVIVMQGGADFDSLVRACLDLGVPVVYYAHTSDLLPLDADLAGNPRLHFIANSCYTASLHADKTIRAVIRPLVPRERYATPTDRTLAVFINPAPYKGLAVVDGLAARRPDVSFLYVVNRRKAVADRGSGILSARNVRVIGPGGLCLEADAPAGEWADAFSELWDDDTRYGRFVEAARVFSLRPEIDVASIVASFVDVVTAAAGNA